MVMLAGESTGISNQFYLFIQPKITITSSEWALRSAQWSTKRWKKSQEEPQRRDPLTCKEPAKASLSGERVTWPPLHCGDLEEDTEVTFYRSRDMGDGKTEEINDPSEPGENIPTTAVDESQSLRWSPDLFTCLHPETQNWCCIKDQGWNFKAEFFWTSDLQAFRCRMPKAAILTDHNQMTSLWQACTQLCNQQHKLPRLNSINEAEEETDEDNKHYTYSFYITLVLRNPFEYVFIVGG